MRMDQCLLLSNFFFERIPYRIIGKFPNHIWIFRIISDCYCNTYLHNGRGNCQEESASGCGLWCYVNDGSGCYDARPSSYGAPYDWSCQACREGEAVRELGEDDDSEFSGEYLLLFVPVSNNILNNNRKHNRIFDLKARDEIIWDSKLVLEFCHCIAFTNYGVYLTHNIFMRDILAKCYSYDGKLNMNFWIFLYNLYKYFYEPWRDLYIVSIWIIYQTIYQEQRMKREMNFFSRRKSVTF